MKYVLYEVNLIFSDLLNTSSTKICRYSLFIAVLYVITQLNYVLPLKWWHHISILIQCSGTLNIYRPSYLSLLVCGIRTILIPFFVCV